MTLLVTVMLASFFGIKAETAMDAGGSLASQGAKNSSNQAMMNYMAYKNAKSSKSKDSAMMMMLMNQQQANEFNKSKQNSDKSKQEDESTNGGSQNTKDRGFVTVDTKKLQSPNEYISNLLQASPDQNSSGKSSFQEQLVSAQQLGKSDKSAGKSQGIEVLSSEDLKKALDQASSLSSNYLPSLQKRNSTLAKEESLPTSPTPELPNEVKAKIALKNIEPSQPTEAAGGNRGTTSAGALGSVAPFQGLGSSIGNSTTQAGSSEGQGANRISTQGRGLGTATNSEAAGFSGGGAASSSGSRGISDMLASSASQAGTTLPEGEFLRPEDLGNKEKFTIFDLASLRYIVLAYQKGRVTVGK